MEICVISGKGGTGKTTVAVNLALACQIGIFLDCDVDTPNLHLLLKPHIISEENYYGPKIAVLNKSKCLASRVTRHIS